MFYLRRLCFFFWSQTALAAIIIVNLVGMFKQFRDICALWRTSKIELVCLSICLQINTSVEILFYFFLTVLLPVFSLAGYLAGSLYSIGVTGARLRSPGGHHIRLNDSHLQNTKVPVFFFLKWIKTIQECTARSSFSLSFSPKTAILGHIPGTGLHFDVKYEEVSSSLTQPVRDTQGLCKILPAVFFFCPQAVEYEGIKIFHFSSPIYFANSDLYVQTLKEKVIPIPVSLFVVHKSL